MKLYASSLENKDLKEKMCLVYGSSNCWIEYAKQVFTSKHDYTHSKKVNSTNLVDWSSLINETTVTDLFSQSKLIEVDLDSFTLNKNCQERLADLTSLQQISNPVLLLSSKSNSYLSKFSWFNNIVKSKLAVQCFDLGDNEFCNWIQDIFKSQGYIIDMHLCEIIALYNHNNPLGVKACLQNLSRLNAPQNLDFSDIENVIFDDLKSNAFSLIGAALSGNEQKCLAITKDLKQSNTSEYLILMSIAREIRALHRCKLFQDQSMLTFTFKKLGETRQKQLKSLTATKLNEMLKYCADIEMTIKGLTVGDSWDMILFLCLSLAGNHDMQGFIHPKEENIV